MSVDDRMAGLHDHPFASQVDAFRRAMLAADDRVGESWKWNAPNFRFNGADRATFRLRPGITCQLILHRGARVRDDVVLFADDTGWIEWKSPDRGVIVFEAPEQLHERRDAIVELCLRWMQSTDD